MQKRRKKGREGKGKKADVKRDGSAVQARADRQAGGEAEREKGEIVTATMRGTEGGETMRDTEEDGSRGRGRQTTGGVAARTEVEGSRAGVVAGAGAGRDEEAVTEVGTMTTGMTEMDETGGGAAGAVEAEALALVETAGALPAWIVMRKGEKDDVTIGAMMRVGRGRRTGRSCSKATTRKRERRKRRRRTRKVGRHKKKSR
mmetsp:Transcript_19285/g.49460  ORF Transcript_19285/g.49460 Transcript_19285/m.49460 type:complete len:202 (+) Transcript_19285:676-1281(+)